MFQFLIGSMEMETAGVFIYLKVPFQFLIGSMEIIHRCCGGISPVWFQFLIGSMEISFDERKGMGETFVSIPYR